MASRAITPQNDANTGKLKDILQFLQTDNSADFDYHSDRSAQLREYFDHLIDNEETYKNNPVYQAIIRGYNSGTFCTGYVHAFRKGGKKSRRQKSRKSRRFRRSRKARR